MRSDRELRDDEIEINWKRYSLAEWNVERRQATGHKVRIIIWGNGLSLPSLDRERTHFCLSLGCREGFVNHIEHSQDHTLLIANSVEQVTASCDTVPFRVPELDDPVSELRRLRVPRTV